MIDDRRHRLSAPAVRFAAGRLSRLALAGCVAGCFTGCMGPKVQLADSGNKQRVDASAFLADDAPASGAGAIDPASPPADTQPTQRAPSPDEPYTLAPIAQPAGDDPAPQTGNQTAPGSNPGSNPNATNPSTGGYTLLDAKIGDINGHPIYANEFFAPIEDRLIAEASRLPAPQWQQRAGTAIALRLDGIIADELLRAEALASLSQQQRLGLRAFLQGFRSDMLSENLGSSQLANRRILEEQGITLDEALRRQEIDTLIRFTLYREINRRVNVSWRDIKQRYERDLDKYAPPPTAVFRRIRVFTENGADVEAVNQQLEGGAAFEEVAASPLNTFSPQTGGEERFEVSPSFEETKFYGIDTLNEHAWSLKPGEWTGPFESGPSTYWLKLEGIEQRSISLYEAQRAIQREIETERHKDEQEKYLGRLIERAHFSSRDEILYELLLIADERYGPSR